MFYKRVAASSIIFIGVIILFAACGKDEGGGLDIPDDVIENGEADPIELKDQLDLELGETGYLVDQGNSEVVEFTVNSVEKTNKLDTREYQGEDGFFLVADVDVKNHGKVAFSLKSMREPDLVAGSDASKIESDSFEGRGELLGRGFEMITIDEALTEQGTLEEGEEASGEVYLEVSGSADEYIIFYGMQDNNQGYNNKAAWEFNASEIES